MMLGSPYPPSKRPRLYLVLHDIDGSSASSGEAVVWHGSAETSVILRLPLPTRIDKMTSFHHD